MLRSSGRGGVTHIGWTDRSPPINWAELEHEAGPPRNCAAALTHTPEENRGGGGHARTRTTRRSERTAEDTRPDKRAQPTVVLEYTRHVYHAISAHMKRLAFHRHIISHEHTSKHGISRTRAAGKHRPCLREATHYCTKVDRSVASSFVSSTCSVARGEVRLHTRMDGPKPAHQLG